MNTIALREQINEMKAKRQGLSYEEMRLAYRTREVILEQIQLSKEIKALEAKLVADAEAMTMRASDTAWQKLKKFL